jgi:hypothetical protein
LRSKLSGGTAESSIGKSTSSIVQDVRPGTVTSGGAMVDGGNVH